MKLLLLVLFLVGFASAAAPNWAESVLGSDLYGFLNTPSLDLAGSGEIAPYLYGQSFGVQEFVAEVRLTSFQGNNIGPFDSVADQIQYYNWCTYFYFAALGGFAFVQFIAEAWISYNITTIRPGPFYISWTWMKGIFYIVFGAIVWIITLAWDSGAMAKYGFVYGNLGVLLLFNAGMILFTAGWRCLSFIKELGDNPQGVIDDIFAATSGEELAHVIRVGHDSTGWMIFLQFYTVFMTIMFSLSTTNNNYAILHTAGAFIWLFAVIQELNSPSRGPYWFRMKLEGKKIDSPKMKLARTYGWLSTWSLFMTIGAALQLIPQQQAYKLLLHAGERNAWYYGFAIFFTAYMTMHAVWSIFKFIYESYKGGYKNEISEKERQQTVETTSLTKNGGMD